MFVDVLSLATDLKDGEEERHREMLTVSVYGNSQGCKFDG
jgi:hypothetical protein